MVVNYSTSDSFGYDKNSFCEALSLHKNHQPAIEMQQAAQASENNSEDGFDFTSSDGVRCKMGWCPWKGYFESLVSVEVLKLTVA